ncbi:hypothetical protein MHUMG1_04077 [Metarhizium humberi]|uniref:Secreted protein n=1 Tax=Metarhizium humberi TaxID=2596975 RepID=A0A9P8S7I8_9HYPO|nr:hypothetical protein MHUMG1_04077 [Metarhizium humberi]
MGKRTAPPALWMVVVFSNALVGHGRQSGDSLLKQAPALRRGPVSHLDQAADLRTLRHQRPGELVARSFPPVTGKDSSNLPPCKTSRVALPQHPLPCSNEDNYRVQGPQVRRFTQ